MSKLCVYILVCVLTVSDAYNVLLFFPFPGKSHAILGDGYVRNLLEAGHNVTYIASASSTINSYRLRQIDSSACITLFPKDMFNIDQKVNKESRSVSITTLMHSVYNYTLHIDAVQQLMRDPNEKFDAVIVEWMYNEIAAGLATVFDCPLIWSSSVIPHTMVLSLIGDNLNPAYTFHMQTKSRSFTLSKRIDQLFTTIKIQYERWSITREAEAIFRSVFEPILTKKGKQLPSYNEVRYNASFMLGNGNLITSDPVALPSNYKDIGGYHINEKADPLPQNFKTVMDNATEGAIYFSLGSLLPVRTMSEEMKAKFLKIFSNLNQTVIWKSDVAIHNVSKNVHVVNWAPQQRILGHPNCRLFITHAGLLSITEAVYFGVPVIGMPFFADQFNNINKAEWTGFGKNFDLSKNSLDDLEGVIDDMLNKPRYRQRAKEVSSIYHHRLITPGQELVHWVEHVIQTRGALHLRSYAMEVEWYQKLYLDLLAILLMALVAVLIIVKYTRSQVNIVVRKNKKTN
ncbi:UDP-glycosyltransferase UGT5-like [Aricia agestis]|uniref:UDP-glycosyltransferase UGT5-like n=1 Tax=Aricia agestis TaxID=91739 RepID=UPI001C2094F8|nr:UDP-glycosyltransferase UGT5-like [Aricia agestis]